MISTRLAPVTLALLLLALVPVAIHTYEGATVDDGLRVAAIPEAIDGMGSQPTPRDAGWGARRFDSFDWVERTYRTPGGRPLQLFAARSFDAKKLYHHPELAVAYGTSFEPSSVTRFSSLPGIPVHVLVSSRQEAPEVAVYALHYEDGFVDGLVAFEAQRAFSSLFQRRRALTLFFVRAEGIPVSDLEHSPAIRLLGAAIEGFLAGGGAQGPAL